MKIDDDKKTLEVEWHDVYDLNVYVLYIWSFSEAITY